MSLQFVVSVYSQIVAIFVHVLPYLAGAGLVFSILTRRWACNPLPPWWRSRELSTDLLYWFVVPLFAQYMRLGLLIVGTMLVLGVTEDKSPTLFEHGRGPWAQLPFWAQILLCLLVSDFLRYWSHRIFHDRAGLWKYHAIHHAAKELNWTSAARFHPVNLMLGAVMVDVVLLLTGVPPSVMVTLAPMYIVISALVHANLNWTFGPLRYVIVSPVFHRWHHTEVDKGGNMNFGSTMAVFDLLFGTFYMPEHELPSEYGVNDPAFPETFAAQIVYPFK
jgi:sterol desaturase/sphingolipid hydroxylase (fatty acid hydroxylase superfamily)